MAKYWNFDEELEGFNLILESHLELNGLSGFPWVMQVPLKDKTYMVNLFLDDFNEERDAYIIRIVIVEENQATEESTEHVLVEECFCSDFDTYIGERLQRFVDAGLYPTSGADDFEFEIYEWVAEHSEEKISDKIFELIIKKCKESEAIFAAEAKRQQYILDFQKEIEELRESA
jgi:hypothetical protein